jgi:hypothetical protein
MADAGDVRKTLEYLILPLLAEREPSPHNYDPAFPSCTLIFQTRSLLKRLLRPTLVQQRISRKGRSYAACVDPALDKKPAPDLIARQARDFDPGFHNLEWRTSPTTWVQPPRIASTATINLRDSEDALLVRFCFHVDD